MAIRNVTKIRVEKHLKKRNLVTIGREARVSVSTRSDVVTLMMDPKGNKAPKGVESSREKVRPSSWQRRKGKRRGNT
jgi:hypothetical protein